MPKVVDSLIEGIRERALGMVFQPTSSGVSGFTFICRIPNRQLSLHLDSSDSFSFISKWVSKGYAKSEQVFSKIFRQCKVSAPEIRLDEECLEEKDLLQKFHRLAQSKKPAMGGAEMYDLMFMNCFDAMTLDSFIREGHLKRLSEKDQETFFQKIGQGVILDLMIANDDRILSYDYESQDFLNTLSPKFNFGNIMVEYPFMDNEQSRFLKEVHFIDNNSSVYLMDKKIIDHSDIVEIGSLFGVEEGDNGSGALSSGIEKATDSEKDEFSPDDHSEKFSEAFKHLTANREVLASYVCQIFLNEEQELSSNKVLIKSALCQGMEEIIRIIETQEIPDDEETSSPYLSRSMELIRRNIQFLKEIQYVNER
ncbi:hypothetical protein wcw_1757 [Waddlia chondrophila WSU 86-1044]|uniref:Uncharacterized protein n=3 Tax=Waddlia chondrophila TaxID=71667 RepID=D6YSQ3_WADCW|nr:hypothetical protein wcw_1757 [Waddlia chondrophila WSU 86-1044]